MANIIIIGIAFIASAGGSGSICIGGSDSGMAVAESIYAGYGSFTKHHEIYAFFYLDLHAGIFVCRTYDEYLWNHGPPVPVCHCHGRAVPGRTRPCKCACQHDVCSNVRNSDW